MTAVDDESITYDNIGNPTSYYNGTRWNFTWEHGRQLAAASNGTTNVTYAYDADGLRTSKTVGTTKFNYWYAGGKLLRMTFQIYDLDFFYDADGNPYSVLAEGVPFYYITNLQGDVLQIVDANGNPVVNYTYDPYGKVLSVTGTMADTLGAYNPLRYRGYVYDTELAMYYLQSRYYDPELCRFINPDSYASTGQGILGTNMFAYCNNNPICSDDPSGHALRYLEHKHSGEGVGAIGGLACIIIAGAGMAVGTSLIQSFFESVLETSNQLIATISQSIEEKRITKAEAEIVTKVTETSKVRYWTATVKPNYIDIGRALTFSQAVHEVQAGRSVFAVTWYEAKAVAIAAGGRSGYNNKSLVPEIDSGKENTPGYYYHYHTYDRSGGHVYYLFGEA